MAVKRRVVWMDDGDWQFIHDRAADEGMTVSAFIRAVTMLQHLDGPAISDENKALVGPDAIADGVTALRAFNSRPFTPVPKEGR